MNIEAIESMEHLAKQVLRMSEEKQNEFFDRLKETLSEDDILTIKKCVGFYHLFTSPSFYKAMQTSLGEQLYNEFTMTK